MLLYQFAALGLSLLSVAQALTITPAYTIVDNCGNTVEPGQDAFALWSVEKNGWVHVDGSDYLRFDGSTATTWTYNREAEDAQGFLGCRVHTFNRDGSDIAFKNVRYPLSGDYAREIVTKKFIGIEYSSGSIPSAISETSNGGKRVFLLSPGGSSAQGIGAVGPYGTTYYNSDDYLHGSESNGNGYATFYLYKQTSATKDFGSPQKCTHDETKKSVNMKGSCTLN